MSRLAILAVLCGFMAIGCGIGDPPGPPYISQPPNEDTNHDNPAVFCGKGTHWDDSACNYYACGACVADPAPPAKTLVCGKGTSEQKGVCIADEAKPAQFISADVVVSPEDPAIVVASFELSAPARVYYLFKYDMGEPWVNRAFSNTKETKGSCSFGSINPGAALYWRLEARNDDDTIVDTRQGVIITPPTN